MSSSIAGTAVSSQSWGSVFVAEFRRIILRPRTLVALAIFATVAILLTVGLTSTTDWAQQQIAAEGGVAPSSAFMGLGLSVSALSFTLGLLCVSSSARDYTDGAAAATLTVVPKRGKLLSTRMVVWAVVAMVVTFVTLLTVSLMYMSRIGSFGDVLAQIGCYTLGVCMLVLVAFACATLIRRGSLAVLAFLGVDLLLPMALSLVSNFLPPNIGEAVHTINRAMPGEVCSAVGNIVERATDPGAWTFAMVALVAWVVVSVAVSYFSFNRYAGASD